MSHKLSYKGKPFGTESLLLCLLQCPKDKCTCQGKSIFKTKPYLHRPITKIQVLLKTSTFLVNKAKTHHVVILGILTTQSAEAVNRVGKQSERDSQAQRAKVWMFFITRNEFNATLVHFYSRQICLLVPVCPHSLTSVSVKTQNLNSWQFTSIRGCNSAVEINPAKLCIVYVF